ncbi:hypothetical protein CB0940_06766 [Cercospora beticola]|uniref:Uncharacterized protein n=1 Tax=Cercospora beticola TaxID=122368 RepID=A0A2G5H7F8_CERBT|nr:hypothetical protein CB0940_06766 [Cercospora beticola]PIA88475.1 hypothetical protein CB0940_06766 [Cercospora beticola]WPB02678.1 hypothetical protein RHO25_007314 [Cercospora beticola]CAK1358653.1 unnamed protein product [Cercospora beticola]
MTIKHSKFQSILSTSASASASTINTSRSTQTTSLTKPSIKNLHHEVLRDLPPEPRGARDFGQRSPAALDVAVPVLAPENDVVERSAELDKRFGPIAILLIKVIGGQLVAASAKAAIDVAKAHLEPEGPKFKDFDQARRAFTPEMAKDLYLKKVSSGIKGVACFNGPYSWAPGSRYEGPIDINFKWDIYHTD